MLQHSGIPYLFHIPFYALDFISNSCLRVFQITMPPQREVRGRRARLNVEELELPMHLK